MKITRKLKKNIERTLWVNRKDYKEFLKGNDGEVKTIGYFMSKDREFINVVWSVSGASILMPMRVALGCVKKVEVIQ